MRLLPAILILAVIQQGRVATPPAFEVSSIKRSDPGNEVTWGACHGTDAPTGNGSWVSGRILPGMKLPGPPGLGRCVMTGVNLKHLIWAAYDLMPGVDIVGGPGWAGSDRFDVESKAENPNATTDAQLQLMLQRLLEDRLKLKVHREIREVSGTVLVVAKSGFKSQQVTDAQIVGRVGGNPAGGLMSFQAMPLSALATYLSSRLGSPFADKTGLTGRYTFELKWTPNETEIGPPGGGAPPPGTPPPAAGTPPLSPASDASLPSIVAALQELGLRLESGKVPVEVVVIDSAERPTQN